VRIDVLTIFPRMVSAPLSEGIVHRAREAGITDLRVHDLREYSEDKHRSVDDAPFGGGPGMVLKAEPILRAFEAIWPEGKKERDLVVLLTPRGRRFDQATARRYAGLERLFLLSGRYEGIDERVPALLGAEEVSLGDFVLTGGEVAALAVIEATVRLLPGALGDEGSAEADSFAADGLLDWPHYTRPAVVRGQAVPEALLSGDHARIRRWRRCEALAATRERRPDLLPTARLSAEDERFLRRTGNACSDADEDETGPSDRRARDNKAAALHK
jgi:tRNA (guanine37-N1)-methyltransferase